MDHSGRLLPRLVVAIGMGMTFALSAANVELQPASTVEGYLARLIINEVPFPGEKFYKSETDTQAAMVSILWVLHNRIHSVPEGYSRIDVAARDSENIIDIITAGGVRGQVDGFYRDNQGRFVCVPRVHKRIRYLTGIGNRGEPGRVARLLNYGQTLATYFVQAGPAGRDYFKDIRRIGGVKVTGRGFGWMTDRAQYVPGGSFVGIPNKYSGSIGGNRFFTLRTRP